MTKDRMNKKPATLCRTTPLLLVLLFLLPPLSVVYLPGTVVDTDTHVAGVFYKQPEMVHFLSLDESLQGGKQTLLDGYVFWPRGSGPFPAIVALHGCAGLFTKRHALNARFADWGRRLAGMGYVVLFPDSFNPRGVTEACTRKDQSGISPYRERMGDAYAALLWLRSQPSVIKDRIGIMGWSNGGTTLLATINSSLKKECPEEFRVAVAFYPGCTTFFRRGNWLPRVPLTILIGEADDWTPAAACLSLMDHVKEAASCSDIITFPNAYHGFDHPNLSMRTRSGLAYTAGNKGIATMGTNQKARETVIELVPKILERYLKDKQQ